MVFKALQVKQVAQYAQHFPQRTRIAEALNDAVEGLQTAFHIDEAARCFGKRRDRQQYVAHVQQRFADKRRKRHHAFRLFQRGYGFCAVRRIDFRLDVEQQNCLFRRVCHFGNALTQVHAQYVRTDAVGGLRQNAQHRAGCVRQLLCGGVNCGVIGMVLHFRAQNHRCFFSVFQARGNRVFRIGRQVFQTTCPLVGMHRFLSQKRHQQFFPATCQYTQSHALFGGAAQAGSQERLFFAQVCADHQYGFVVRQRFDTLSQPLRTIEVV